MNKQRAFTLIEIMVALFIFAILAIIVAFGLHAVLKTRDHLQVLDEQARQMEVAFALMQRDFSQIIDRPALDAYGDARDSLVAPSINSIEFTRAGFLNPLAASQRSELQRVGYSLEGDQLIRTTWSVLDLPPGAEPLKRVLLQGIVFMSIQYVDYQGQIVNTWILQPQNNLLQQDPNQRMPRAIIVNLQFITGWKITRIFTVDGVGLNEPLG